jgi:hypothetical protein
LPRARERSRKKQRPAISADKIDAMTIGGLDYINVTWIVVTCDHLTSGSTPVFAIPAHQYQTHAPAPRMGVHLIVVVGGYEVMEKDGRPGAPVRGVPPRNEVAIEVRLLVVARDVLHSQGAREHVTPGSGGDLLNRHATCRFPLIS